MAAATAAALNGASVILIDDNPAPGGQIARAKHGKVDPQIQGELDKLLAAGGSVRQQESVVDLPCPGRAVTFGPDGKSLIGYKNLILATGSRELFLPFPGCTLPGVMGAGGLQALAKGGLDVRGKRIVVSGSGPLLLPVAHFLTAAGAILQGPFEQVRHLTLARFAATAMAKGKAGELANFASVLQRYRPNTWVVEAHGSSKLETVQLSNGKIVACDYLACSYGLVPNTELARLIGCELEGPFVKVDSHQRTSVENVFCVGEPTGIGGHEKGTAEGIVAGTVAAGATQIAEPLIAAAKRTKAFVQVLEQAFKLRPELLALADPDTIVCRCEDVTYGRLKNQPSLKDAKLQTRCGMGPCQGRICGPAMQHLFGWQPDTVRPPIIPVPLSDLISQET